VNDGSTDGTDRIVQKYASEHPWIKLVTLPAREGRDFAGKARAFAAGYSHFGDLDYDAIGSLDADISFDPDYFSFLLDKLTSDPALGLVGTPFAENGQTYDYRFVSIEHVSGACQLFRRECFEQIGGYVPMPTGGVDHVAVITARMRGWRTRTFADKVCHHHRAIGSALHGTLRGKIKVGKLDYELGSHPLWEMFRVAYQCSKPPMVVGGCMIGWGYFSSMIRGSTRPVSPELVRFRQREQMRRLGNLFRGKSGRSSREPNREILQSETRIG
jgi:glycosyltransferase involved in cell wall biosynthesis